MVKQKFNARFLWWHAVILWMIVVVVFFAGWDFVETHSFPDLDRETMRIAHLIRDALGAVVTSVLALLAVSLQFRRQALMAEEKRALNVKLRLFYSAFENSSDAILITDLTGRMGQTNRAFTDLFGYTQEEALGKGTNLLRSAHSSDEFYQKMWASIQTRGEWKGEIVNRDKWGEEIPIWLTITPIYEGERKIGYMGIEIDLREKKQLEERLLRAEKLAAIGQMSAQVAHEIRNPLSSVSLNTELLVDEITHVKGEEAVEAKRLLNSISSEVDRLSAICDEYLRLSSLPKPVFDTVQVNDVLRQLSSFLAAGADRMRIEVRMELDPALQNICADSRQLEQAFLNLMKNAFEAMPEGGLLSIETHSRASGVEILFSDTGRGMVEGIRKKLYDPFFTTKDKGTGLGMTITLQIIEQHGGKIECLSAYGRGTTFSVYLPLTPEVS
ncbi:MAG: PAS domain S-box protein [Deltaproteobacteria bacterium]|nr:PAS domain S-box protein [Deltaproteobacteria bacterium]